MIATPSIVSSRAIASQRPKVLRNRSVDHWMLGAVLLLIGIGIVMVYDASFFIGQERYGNPYALVRRHLFFLAAGLVVSSRVMQVETRTLERVAYPIAFASLLLVALTLVPHVGQVRNGARRWLPLVVLSFEPSEMLKPAFALYLARSLQKKQGKTDSFLFGVLPHLMVLGVAAVLLLLQPDFGAAMVLVALTFAMMFAAGARPIHLGALCLATLPGVVALIWTKPYRWARLVAFLDPWGDPQNGGFQLVQSLLAFGSGGVCESVIGEGDGAPTGVFFPDQSAASIINAIDRFDLAHQMIEPSCCRRNAERFSPARFRQEFRDCVEGLQGEGQAAADTRPRAMPSLIG